MVSPELLGRQSFFGELNSEQLQHVAALAREASVPAGGALFYERHPADTLYVPVEGAVELYHSANDVRTAEALYFLPSRVIKIDALRLRELCRQDAALHNCLLMATARTAMQRLHFTRAQLAAERA